MLVLEVSAFAVKTLMTYLQTLQHLSPYVAVECTFEQRRFSALLLSAINQTLSSYGVIKLDYSFFAAALSRGPRQRPSPFKVDTRLLLSCLRSVSIDEHSNLVIEIREEDVLLSKQTNSLSLKVRLAIEAVDLVQPSIPPSDSFDALLVLLPKTWLVALLPHVLNQREAILRLTIERDVGLRMETDWCQNSMSATSLHTFSAKASSTVPMSVPLRDLHGAMQLADTLNAVVQVRCNAAPSVDTAPVLLVEVVTPHGSLGRFVMSVVYGDRLNAARSSRHKRAQEEPDLDFFSSDSFADDDFAEVNAVN
jgi:hypothetical protein